MTIISDDCTINTINDASRGSNDASKSIIDDSRVMLQIVASFTDDLRRHLRLQYVNSAGH